MDNVEAKEKEEEVKPVIEPVLGEKKVHGLEDGVFGRWSVRLRNFSGLIACLTVCINSLIYVYATFYSVTTGHGWPDRTSLMIITAGPALVAWAWVDVSKVLRIITQADGVGDKIRKRTIQALTRPSDSPPPSQQP